MAKSFNDVPAPIQGADSGGVWPPVAAVIVVVLVVFVDALNDQRANLQKQVAQLKADNDRDEAFRQQQTEYLNRIEQLPSQLVTLQSIVPDDQATDEFMRTVFADGLASSTEIRTFIPKAPAVRDYYVETPYNVHLDGTYYELLNFFDRSTAHCVLNN